MALELVVDVKENETDFALMQDGKLIELYNEAASHDYHVGDIYLAKVKKLAPGLNACFIDLGYHKDAFLHYHDLGPQLLSQLSFIKRARSEKQYSLKNFKFEPDIDKNGNIKSVLQPGQYIMVQIVKEPISTKGPRLSSELSLAGRFIVLVPFSNKISVSQKIKNKEEKSRLKKILKDVKPNGFGIIVRTVAQNQPIEELQKDLKELLRQWGNIVKRLNTKKVPYRVFSESSTINSYLRDVYNDEFRRIVINNKDTAESAKNFLDKIPSGKPGIIQLYTGEIPIFEKYGVEKQIKTSFGKVVPMSKGAYLIIEHTEAMHVIDVNSGGGSNNKDNQEDNAQVINTIAAEEIARQLRLRDMGGIIVVDFIDMHTTQNKRKLFDTLNETMKNDRAKSKILPPSKFGLVQITRQRVRPELNIDTKEPNPELNKEIESPLMLIREIENDIDGLYMAKGYKKAIQLHAHPFVIAYLKKGFPSIHTKWFFKYKKSIKLVERDAFSLLQYEILDKEGKEIK